MHRVAEESPSAKELPLQAMKEGENEISLNQLSLSNEHDDDIDGENGDYFPFSALSDELIGHTFSFLSIKDRMRARVNKRLNKIELENKYYVEKLEITEKSRDFPIFAKDNKLQRINFVRERSYSSDCIRRLTENLSIGELEIELSGSNDFHREVYNLIKSFDIGTLNLYFLENKDFENEMTVDSFYLGLSKSCTSLYLDCVENVTPDAIHQVYKMMKEGSTKLRKIGHFINKEKFIPFLALIGITFRNGRFFSKRQIEETVHARELVSVGVVIESRLFDGNIEIYISRLMMDLDSIHFAEFSLELHESRESLENAKHREGFQSVGILTE